MAFSIAGRKLTFADEFSALSLNDGTDGTWTTHYAFDGGGGTNRSLGVNHELQIYVDPGFAGSATTPLGLNPFAINNGVLSITAAPTPAGLVSTLGGFQYTSGLLTTEGTFAQQYGYFEMRAQAPAGTGLWPCFWLLPQALGTPGEIDIMEMIGQQPSTLYLSTHGYEYRAVYQGPNLTTGFHTYGLDWNAATITWYLDGTAVASEATPAQMKQPMYLLLDLAVGGDWPGAPDASTSFPASFQIDYVHAYADPSHVVALPDLPDSGKAAAWLVATAAGQTLTATNVNTELTTYWSSATLVGGTGDDTFCVCAQSDVVRDWSGGIDTVRSWADRYALTTGVENLKIEVTTGATGIGNASNNEITGNGGNDTLVAGTKTSVLTGGAGSDLFVTDHATTVMITDFTPGAGGDVLKLDAPQFHDFNDLRGAMAQLGADVVLKTGDASSIIFENAALGSFTAANFILPLWLPTSETPGVYQSATASGQVLTASQANAQLSTGYGNVTLVGAGGDNTYLVANNTDVVVQGAGGVNTVHSWAYSTTLPANVQNLTIERTTDAVGIGNALNNIITGNAGNDSLSGGAGNDILNGGGGVNTLSGGAGDDLFVFTAADHDSVITDFTPGHDHLDLRPLLATLGTSASPIMADRVIITSVNGNAVVNIDPDGTGPQAGHKLVTLQGVAASALHPEVDFFH
jgi:beta-glucanase (GH16 family)